MTTTTLALDFETFSEAQLTGARSVGIHNYFRHASTKPLMLAWSWNDGPVEQIDFTAGDRLPSEVEDGLLDPHVLKWGYNSAFERLATRILLGIKTPIKGWRCAMALAYMRSFNGGLDDIGEQLGLSDKHLKDKRGKALIRKFSIPQIKRRKHMEVYSVCTRETDPEEWQEYLDYNRQDVVSETAIRNELLRYPLLESEWELYGLDQRINDRGLPIDLQFVSQAAKMARLRKMELTMKLEEITGLANPHSQPQLLPWLQDNHYPYEEIQKATVLKALLQHKQNPFLTDSAVAALNVRQQSNRTSVAKYSAVEQRVSADMTIKHCFQFAGASRTNRWSGRAFQPQNLGRTPKFLEGQTEVASELIREGDYFGVSRIHPEVMAVLAGSVRSSIRAPERHTLVVCDLSAIESAVIAWLSGCERMLNVFRDGRDPYKDFGIELYAKAYDEITKDERTICKPAVLGCGFGLGGGGLRDGKRTGLWGYAEAMGIEISNDEAKRQVALFRETYPEIPKFWQDLDDGAKKALRGKAVVVGRIKMQMRGKFLTMELPSGRLMFYHKPRFEEREFTNADGEKYTRLSFTHMGIIQGTKKWDRVLSGGPKITENLVQATARDVLAAGMLNAHRERFKIVGSVHDEIITLQKIGSNFHNLDALRSCMIHNIPWADGLPLNAAGYEARTYRKD